MKSLITATRLIPFRFFVIKAQIVLNHFRGKLIQPYL